MSTKKETTKEEIKLKQIGKNFITVVDNKKYTLVNPSKKVLETLKTKILIFNKRNSGIKKKEILEIVDIKTQKEEVLKTKVKGIIKVLKKDTKKRKSTKTKEVVKTLEQIEVDLISKVETAFNNKELTEEEIKRLEDLLAQKKIAIEEKKEPIAEIGESTNGRESYR